MKVDQASPLDPGICKRPHELELQILPEGHHGQRGHPGCRINTGRGPARRVAAMRQEAGVDDSGPTSQKLPHVPRPLAEEHHI